MSILFAAVNEKRNAHAQLNPVTGLLEPTLLLEGARTNRFLHSRVLSNAVWAKDSVTVTGDATLTFAGGDWNRVTQQMSGLALAGTTAVTVSAFFATADAGKAVRVIAFFADGTWSYSPNLIIDATGFVAHTFNTGKASNYTDVGITNRAEGGAQTVTVLNAQLEIAPAASSAIYTTTAAATRASDALSYAWPHAPQEMTLYMKFIERGSITSSNARLFEIGAGTNPRFFVGKDGPSYVASLVTAGGAVQTGYTAAYPVVGDLVEARAVLHANGAVTYGQAINGGAEQALTNGGGLALPGAWSGPTIWINSIEGSAVGFNAFTMFNGRPFRAATGVRSLAYMRAMT
jgi:hypothetical protein